MTGYAPAALAAAAAAAAGWLAVPAPAAGRLAASAPEHAGPGIVETIRRSRSVRGAAWTVLACLVAGALAAAPIAAGAMGGGGYVLLRRRKRQQAQRAARIRQAADVPLLRALAAELRSGLPPAEALLGATAETPSSSDLAQRMRAAAAADGEGRDVASVLAGNAAPGSDAAALAIAWTVCSRSGASLALPVTRLAEGAAGQLRTAREADAAMAASRSSARLLALLPFGGLALGALSGTGSLTFLLRTSAGQLCLLAAVALDLAGLAWLDRLADAATR